jgi:cytochrome c oxidase subunit 3
MPLKSTQHPYHIVTPSPWPILTALAILAVAFNAVAYFHRYKFGGIFLIINIVYVIVLMTFWWRDVIREATYEGKHTLAVQRGLRIGVVLFIVSEIMFFFSFFWAFFHSSLSPSVEIGCIWPPSGITPLSMWGVPLLNTYLLLYSGVTITYTHHAITSGLYLSAIEGFVATLTLAVSFTCLQLMEYIEAPFTIADGIYGSTFFMMTGFHGLHVIVGTIFIFVCFVRCMLGHFTKEHHIGFEAAAWYWHFVDVVWAFLYIFVYVWGA